MALPPIQVQIVAGGHERVLEALKTVEKAQRASEDRMKIVRERSAQQHVAQIRHGDQEVRSSADRRVRARQDEATKTASAAKKAHDAEMRQQRSFTDQLMSEFRRRSHLLNNTMKMFGSPGPSQMMKGGSSSSLSSMFGGGSSGGGSSAAGGLGMGEMALAGGVVAGALAAVALIKTSFDILVDGIKAGVGVFTDAILQIGGGFNVSKALVEGAKNERSTVELATSMPGLVDPAKLEQMIQRLSKGSMYTRQEHIDAARSWAEKNGSLEGYEEIQPFIGKVAATGTMSLKDTTELAAKMRKANPKMSQKDLQETILGLAGLGQQGTIEAKSFVGPEGAKLIANASVLQGGLNSKNINTVAGVAEAVAGGVGMSAETAVTSTDALFRDLKQMASKPKYAHQIKALGGTFNNGQLGNVDAILGNLVVQDVHGTLGRNVGLGARSRTAVAALRSAAQIEEGDTDDVIRQKVAAVQAQYNHPETMDNLNKKFELLSDTIDVKVKKSFNEMNAVLVEQLLPQLKAIAVGPLSDMVAAFKNNSVLIGDAGRIIVDFLKVFASTLELISPVIKLVLAGFLGGYHAMIKFAEFVMEGVGTFIQKIPGLGDTGKKMIEVAGGLERLADSLGKAEHDLTSGPGKTVNDVRDLGLKGQPGTPGVGNVYGPVNPASVYGPPNPNDASKPDLTINLEDMKKAGTLFNNTAFTDAGMRNSGILFADAFVDRVSARASELPLPTNGQPPPVQGR